MRLQRLIVNADDAGIDDARNRGIREAFERGIVTSATVLAAGEAFESFAAFARGAPRLGVGVHLALTECVPPLSPRGVAGAFVEKELVWERLRAGEIDSAEIEAEFAAQIERVLAAGLAPTHVDGHNHVHVFPAAREALARLASRYELARVQRRPLELDGPLGSSAKRDLVRALLGGPFPWRTTSCFAGFCLEGDCTVERVLALVAACPGPSLELMTHPGLCTADSVPFSADPARERELEVLTDPRLAESLRAAGVELVHFGAL